MTSPTAHVILYGDRMTELRVVLDQMTCAPYNDPATKLEKAYKAVFEERITVLDASQMIFSVTSAVKPEVSYRVHDGTCQCPYARAHPAERFSCHHAVAAQLYQRWQQCLAPLVSQKEPVMPRTSSGPVSAPLLTTDVESVPPVSSVSQEASDDIADPVVPPALLAAVAEAPPASLPADFGAHEALLQGFCQYLQGAMHKWLMEEHRTLTAGMDVTMTAMRDYAKQALNGNEHAAYQLSDALLKLQEHGLPLRHDPYVVSVQARSPEGFALHIQLSKNTTEDLLTALPALLGWLKTQGCTPLP